MKNEPSRTDTIGRTFLGFSSWALTLAAITLFQPRAHSTEAITHDRAGDVYEIRLEREYRSEGDGSSGSSRSRMALIERVIEVRDNGVALEFDLPPEASPKVRAQSWQFPVRVFKASDGSLELPNFSNLETRMLSWLESSGLDKSACGKWIFTWTAAMIECDPKSVLMLLEPFDLRLKNLREDTDISEKGALNPAPLSASPKDSGGLTFVAEFEVDPEEIRRQRAEADVAAADITGDEPLQPETALQKRSSEKITGTIRTTIETDDFGRVTRRVRVSQVDVELEDGSMERQITTETVTRSSVSGEAD